MTPGNDDYQSELQALLEEAQRLFEQDELVRAAELYRQAISLATDGQAHHEEHIYCLMRLGDIHHRLGAHTLALQCYEEAGQRAEMIDFTHGALDCKQRSVATLVAEGRWSEAIELASEGRAVARAALNTDFETVFLGLLGQLERRGGHFEKALEYAFDGLRLAQQTGNFDEELTFLADMSLIALSTGDYEGALRQADAGLRRAKETGRVERCAVFLGQKCHALRGLGDLTAAKQCASQGLEAARERGDRKEVATFHHDLAVLAHGQNDRTTAREQALAAYRLFLELGNKEGALTSLRCLCLVFAELRDWEAAYQGLIDGLVLAATMDQRLFMGMFFHVGHITKILWKQRAYDDISRGLTIVTNFLSSIERELEGGQGTTSCVDVLRMVLSCLEHCAASQGVRDGEHWQAANELARSVDETVNAGMTTLLTEFYR